jgi:hypothetical protein
VSWEEALCLTERFELLHLPLSWARRLARVLGSVTESLVLAVLNGGHDLSLRRAVAGEVIGDHDTGLPICLFSSLRSSRLAGRLSRQRWTRTSSTTPAWSTARHNQCFTRRF